MKAIVVREFGEPEVLKVEETPMPKIGVSQVLVQIHAAGVNPVDTYIRQGSHPTTPPLPFTPGKDGAGIVDAVGSGVKKVTAGDRVYLAGAASGTYAEYALCEVDQVWKLPENSTFEEGAGVFVPYATAYRALFERAQAKRGETLLIHGASGAVGIAGIQWAKYLGMRIIGTAGSEKGKLLASETGADYVFDHSEENYLKRISEVTGGEGVQVILEMLANVNLQKDFDVLAKSGRIVVIGSRGSLDFSPRSVMAKEASILGMSLFNSSKQTFEKIHAEIFKGLESGYLRPRVGKSVPLSEAASAHHDVIENKAFGKIVLIPDDIL